MRAVFIRITFAQDRSTGTPARGARTRRTGTGWSSTRSGPAGTRGRRRPPCDCTARPGIGRLRDPERCARRRAVLEGHPHTRAGSPRRRRAERAPVEVDRGDARIAEEHARVPRLVRQLQRAIDAPRRSFTVPGPEDEARGRATRGRGADRRCAQHCRDRDQRRDDDQDAHQSFRPKIVRKNRNTFNTSRKIDAAKSGATPDVAARAQPLEIEDRQPREDHQPGDRIDERAIRDVHEDQHDAEGDQRDQRPEEEARVLRRSRRIA